MFPLKVFRFFEQATDVPHASTTQRRASVAQAQGNTAANNEATWPEVDRRQNPERRQADRREKQQAILLNTRKLQGRRKNPGRRLDDKLAAPHSRIHVSVKG